MRLSLAKNRGNHHAEQVENTNRRAMLALIGEERNDAKSN